MRKILNWDPRICPNDFEKIICRERGRPYLRWDDWFQHTCGEHYDNDCKWFELSMT